MAHEHGSEYQLRVVLPDGTEHVTDWFEEKQIQVTMSAVQGRGKSCWLRVRKVVCVQCADSEECLIAEYPVAQTGSSRNRPHDSGYLMAAGVRNRSEVFRPR